MTAIPSYFNLNAVSNSNLKELEKMFYVKPDNREGLQEIFNFGSLVDALLTEAWRVNWSTRELHLETGELVFFDVEAFELAKKLVALMKADRVISRLLDCMISQYVFMRTLTFEYEGTEHQIKARCKFDGFSKLFKIGVDYKGLSVTSEAQFLTAVDFFDYDQQAAWYMDLAGIDSHWIIAISKKNGKIFKLAIKRGDEIYLRGRAKYSKWAYRWIMLIENFIV